MGRAPSAPTRNPRESSENSEDSPRTDTSAPCTLEGEDRSGDRHDVEDPTPQGPAGKNAFRSSPSTRSVQSETFAAISRHSTDRSSYKAQNGGFSRWCCCRRWKAPPFKQVVVILRHSERLDCVDPYYRNSEEGQRFPFDTPLTEKGIQLAREVAQELAVLTLKANFAIIASSPYKRCLQTAAQIASVLKLPVVIDQEMGEVREKAMPQDSPAHRSPEQLQAMAQDLGLTLLNPMRKNGGVKIFGKQPPWPERLEEAKNRYIVRLETYIRQSRETRQNMILVTHADAVAAALVMFERGSADVQKMDFCARVMASRSIEENRWKRKKDVYGVFAEKWAVSWQGLGAEILHDEVLARYNERLYLETCEETEQRVNARNENRSKTDCIFDKTIKEKIQHAVMESEGSDTNYTNA